MENVVRLAIRKVYTCIVKRVVYYIQWQGLEPPIEAERFAETFDYPLSEHVKQVIYEYKKGIKYGKANIR